MFEASLFSVLPISGFAKTGLITISAATLPGMPAANGAAMSPSPPVGVNPLGEQLPEFVDYLPAQLQPAWGTISQYPVLQGLIIATLFFALAHIVRGLVVRSMAGLASKSATTLDDDIIRHLRKPLFYTIFLFGLILAAKASKLPAGSEIVVNGLLSLIIINWIGALMNISSILLHALGNQEARFHIIEERTIPILDLIFKLLILLIGSYVLLLVWGINPVGWLASAGIVGIALGFAAKDTLANLFSGFFILADAPYQLGDYVNLDSGERGMVTHIGMRSTRLLTRDDVEITLPNAVIANSKIINESGGPHTKMRVRLDVGAAYGSDVDQVCEVLQQVSEHHKDILHSPAPRVRMRGFGPSSLDFQLMGWIGRPEDRGRVLHELYMDTYKAFASAGIEIPYTKTDVYIKEMPGMPGSESAD